MEDGRWWKMEDGVWRMEGGRWKMMEVGRWNMKFCQIFPEEQDVVGAVCDQCMGLEPLFHTLSLNKAPLTDSPLKPSFLCLFVHKVHPTTA